MSMTLLSTFARLTLSTLLLLAPAFAARRAAAQTSQQPAARPAPAPAAAAAPPKYALLVGINDYFNNSRMKDLKGCENDVLEMSNLLRETYTFPKNNVVPLLSQQATRAAILKNFEDHLIGNARSYLEKTPGATPARGVTVVFYFSGHGSYTEDKNGDEGDPEGRRLDETIVPQDSGKPGIYDILDDEIEELFQRLSKYTSNVTFIFDSCHSGTATRGPLPREAKPDPRPQPAQSKPQARGAGDSRSARDISNGILPRDEGYVAVSGCLPSQQSYELPYDIVEKNGKREHGTMTFYLVHTLRLNPRLTYREAMASVRDSVQRVYSYQSPQVEGALDREFFGGSDTTARPSVKVLGYDEAAQTMELQVGEAEGVRGGAFVVVYDATRPSSGGDDGKLAVGEVKNPGMFKSEVTLTPVPGAPRKAKATDRVLLVAPNSGTAPLRAALDVRPWEKAAPGRADAVRQTMLEVQRVLKEREEKEKVSLVKAALVPEPLKAQNKADWDVAVVRATYKEYAEGLRLPPSREVTPPENQEGFYLAKADGFPLNYFWLPAGDPAKTAEALARALEYRARQENVRALKNEASPLHGKVKLELLRLPGLRREGNNAAGDRKELFCPADQAGAPKLRLGEWYRFRFTNTSDKTVLVYLYNLGTSGKVGLLYPKPGEEVELRPGQSIVSSLHDAGLPLGVDGYKLLVTTTPINPLLLVSPGLSDIKLRGEDSSKNDANPLNRALRSYSSGTRDSGGESVSFEGWATTDYEYVLTVDDSSICQPGSSAKAAGAEPELRLRVAGPESRKKARRRAGLARHTGTARRGRTPATHKL